jgi:membrane peptidoglycan carboxypeptidase
MATGASVLASQGILRQPYAIENISRNGTYFYQHKKDDGVQVLDPKVAFIMEQIMSNDNNRSMIFGRHSLLTLPNRRVGVKTGTSDSFADAWTVGYTPHLVAAVWTGNPDWRQKMTKDSDSYVVAAPAWHNFMQTALDDLRIGDEWFSEPAGLTHKRGARRRLAGACCPAPEPGARAGGAVGSTRCCGRIAAVHSEERWSRRRACIRTRDLCRAVACLACRT